ncbi:CHAT domain-containing tetratricopeptide repeat protein [Candidatus Oscillochloris fontis]|uniref:CHAT domain-containing tetratricopeptide repeat protein n=1 Tax=Candidatus Oscillochloris fontis TaxID=2496868 RepID=UPI00101BCB95|nr:CHAT domain-containing protein [Candidatus Oscillochloris fontis]
MPPTIPPRCIRIRTLSDRRPRRAVGLAQRWLSQLPADHPDRPWAYLALGWAWVSQQRLEAARAAFVQSEGATTELYAHYGQMFIAFLQGASAEQQAEWSRLVAQFRQVGAYQEAVDAQITQLRHLNKLERSSEWLAHVATLQAEIALHGSPAAQALFQRTLGIAYLQVGDYAAAVSHLGVAEQHFAALGLPAEQAKTWFEFGRIAFFQSNYATALRYQHQALACFDRFGLPMWVAFCQKNIGTTEAHTGHIDRAITTLLQARAIFASIDMPAHCADCDLNLGNAAYHSGLYELAISAWRQAEDQYLVLGQPLLTLVTRRNQVEAYLHLGAIAQAEALLQRLIREVRVLDSPLDHGEILCLFAEVRRIRGDLPSALAALREAEAIFRRLEKQIAVGRVHIAQAEIALDQGDSAAAQAAFLHAAQEVASSPLYYWQALYGLGRCAEAMDAGAVALQHYQQACHEVAHLRQHMAEAQASNALFTQGQALYTAALRLAFAHGEPRLLLELAEQQRALALYQQMRRLPVKLPASLQASYEQSRQRLRSLIDAEVHGAEMDAALQDYLKNLLYSRHYGADADDRPYTPLDLDALRAELIAQYGTAWSVLYYLAFEETLLLLSFDAHRLDLTPIALDRRMRRELERACLPSFRRHIYQHGPWPTLEYLGEHLIPGHVRAYLQPDQRLLIIPAATLHTLPWAALRLNAIWLIEQAVIQLLPSLQVWRALVAPDAATETHAPRAACLIGVQDFGGRADPLPSALPSLDLVQRLWPGSTTRWENAEVTRAALRSADLQPFALLHIATHGQLSAGRGLLAHLKLADDDLLADEIVDLQLRRALVVLAACEGALGEALPSEDLLNLSRAFIAAGATDVVASLWELFDTMVLALLEPFYTALVSGCDAPTALAHAQRNAILQGQSEGSELGLPYIWASLCASGGGSSIRLSVVLRPGC